MNPAQSSPGQWSKEVDDLVRGASGGFLFGIPLLYTMEVWWIGSFINPQRMLVALAITFGIVFVLNRTAGFRRTEGISFFDGIIATVEALAISTVCAGIILVLLRRITIDTPLPEILGKIVYEAVPFAVGVALANQLLRAGGEANHSQHSQNEQPQDTRKERINGTLADIGATLVGAMFIAATIAPTDEIPMLVVSLSHPWLLGLMAASLVISYGIVFEAGFADQERREQQRGIFQRPLSETIVSYLISVAAAALMLWFFHQLSFNDPWQMWLNYSIVLGLPATIGGAAGRLAV